MAKIVDARGLACPQPVILTRKALAVDEAVTTIVDNDTAQHNVTRMAERAGCTVQGERLADGIYVHIARQAGGAAVSLAAAEAPAGAPAAGTLVLLVGADTLGQGDAELGAILMRSFFHTLSEVTPRPSTVVLINSGVKLAVSGSAVLADLQALAAAGTAVLACGTCLNHYALLDALAVGEVSNMYSIAETLLRAGKVLCP
jgi:selenium metabolism protein YedF